MKTKNSIEINIKIVRRTLDSINSVLPSLLEDRSIHTSKYNLTSELLKSLDRQLRLAQQVNIDDYKLEKSIFNMLISSGRLITSWSEFMYDRSEFLKEMIIFSDILNTIEQQLGLNSQDYFETSMFLN